MATADFENYIRLHLLNVEGGGPVLRELVNVVQSSSAKGSLFDYLQCFKTHITAHRHAFPDQKYYEQLFPASGNVDISQWDITLLIFVVICVCTLEGKLILDLRQLLNQEVNKPIHDRKLAEFLLKQQTQICALKGNTISDEQYEKLFPPSGSPFTLKLEEWDDDLLTAVLSSTNSLIKATDKLKECIGREAAVFEPTGDLDAFLDSSKRKYAINNLRKVGKITNAQFQQVYPPVAGIKTNIDTWDYTVLCVVALNVTETLTQTTVNAVKVIRDSSNTISHTNNVNIDYDEFLDIWGDLFSAIQLILTLELPHMKSDVTERINKFKKGHVDIQWAFPILKKWYHHDESILVKLQKMEESAISRPCITERNIKDHVDTKIKEVIRQLTEMSPLLDRDAVTIEGLRAKVTIRSDDKEMETLLQNFIIEGAKAAKEGPIVDSDHPIKDTVNKFITFLQQKASVKDATVGRSIGSVLDLPQSHLTGNLQESLDTTADVVWNTRGVPVSTSASFYDEDSQNALEDIGERPDKWTDDACLYRLCIQRGRKSAIVRDCCNQNISGLKMYIKSFRHAWAAYRPHDENKIIFVVKTDHENDVGELPYPLDTLTIQYIHGQHSSKEDEDIMFSEKRTNKLLTKNELYQMNTTEFSETSKELLNKHTNINIIKACSVKSKGYGTPSAEILSQTCIVLYVQIKGLIPIQEDSFPSALNNFPIDVREGTFELYSNAQEYHEDLKMGLQFTGECPKSGTLGAIVDLPDNSVGCIVPAHVVLSSEDYKILQHVQTSDYNNLKVFQPDSRYEPFGIVMMGAYAVGGNGTPGVEVCLIKITDPRRTPMSGQFPSGDFTNAGFTRAEPMEYRSGEICTDPDTARRLSVIKFGSETGITTGHFDLSGPCILRGTVYENDKDITIELHDQLQVITCNRDHPFAVNGDSGSLVFIPYQGNDQDLRPVGILTGGSVGGKLCYVTPLRDALTACGLNNTRLKSFVNTQTEHMDME